MGYKAFIASSYPVLVFFLIVPLVLLWLSFFLFNVKIIYAEVGSVISIITFLALFIEYHVRFKSKEMEQSEKRLETRYTDQFRTNRSLATSLITVAGIFISLLGSGTMFGTMALNPLLIMAFISLILSAVAGFFSLDLLSDSVAYQRNRTLKVYKNGEVSFWFSARYQLELFIFALPFLISGILI